MLRYIEASLADCDSGELPLRSSADQILSTWYESQLSQLSAVTSRVPSGDHATAVATLSPANAELGSAAAGSKLANSTRSPLVSKAIPPPYTVEVPSASQPSMSTSISWTSAPRRARMEPPDSSPRPLTRLSPSNVSVAPPCTRK